MRKTRGHFQGRIQAIKKGGAVEFFYTTYLLLYLPLVRNKMKVSKLIFKILGTLYLKDNKKHL